MECGRKSTDNLLMEYCKRADIVYHFAGVMRPTDRSEFQTANIDYTQKIIHYLEQSGHSSIFVYASSIQAALEGRFAGSEYGKSKKKSEDLLIEYAERTHSKVLLYRFPGIFGKWCRPNYNSVVATFCYNISRSLPIQIHDASVEIELAYIDDVVKELLSWLNGREKIIEKADRGYTWKYCCVPERYSITVGELAEMLLDFRRMQDSVGSVPDKKEILKCKMWNTYFSYLPENYVDAGSRV